MAIATTINFAGIDGKGKTSNTKVRVPSSFSVAQYREFAADAAQLLVEISNIQVTSVSITYEVDISGLGLKAIASAVEKVAAKIQGIFATASGIIAKWLIPAGIEEKVVAGSDDFDQADGDVAALVSAYEDGIAVTGGTFAPTNGRGDDVTAVKTVKETFLRRAAG